MSSLERPIDAETPPLAEFLHYDPEDLHSFMSGFSHVGIADVLVKERITGEFLLILEDSDIQKLFEVTGDRMCIKKLQVHYRRLQSPAITAGTSGTSTSTVRVLQQIQESTSPLTVSAWVHSYKPPRAFSNATQDYLEGRTELLTYAIKSEIIQAVFLQIVEFTRCPTSAEYTAVAQKVVQTYPALKDKNTSLPWATLKRSLIMKFRNKRRPVHNRPKRPIEDSDATCTTPPKKRQREEFCNILEEDEQQELVKELKWRWSKKPKVGNRIMEITDALFKGRRELIQFKQPSVNDLLELFPSLESAKILYRELNKIVGRCVNLEEWELWEKRVFNYAKATYGDKYLQELTSKIDEAEDADDERAYHTILLLTKVLAGKVKKERTKIVESMPSDCDIEAIAKDCVDPYILRLEGDCTIQYYILVEGLVLSQAKHVKQALLVLLAAYFTFNIKYPRFLSPFYCFVQNYILLYQQQKREGITVTETYKKLVSMDSVVDHEDDEEIETTEDIITLNIDD